MISTKEILSIDLGKFNSVFAELNQESKKVGFRSIPSSPGQVRQALVQKPR